jgi:hypothetical protein
MKLSKILPLFLLMIACISLLVTCSKARSPVESDIGNLPGISNDLHESIGTGTVNRSLLAVYDAVIDPESGIFTIAPIQRAAEYHLPLTNLYPNVLQITSYGFTPNFWADIKLTHPLPGSGIDGFDPRVIAIIPANSGVSMNYPVFNVVANNRVVLNQDGYTKLYDDLGGSIPGNTNPFLAYFKHVEYRRWFSSGSGMTSDTRRWDMDINGFGGPMQFKLVVDVSLNYPNPPQPVIDNAPEPVEMNANISTGLLPNGGFATIDVILRDWQGLSDIKCKVESPGLFNGAIQLMYSHPGQDPDEYIFSGTIPNELQASVGEYPVLISAWDIPTGIHTFNESTALVSNDIAFNPVDVTPPWLNFSPEDICVEGNYAYIAGNINGLHIFDISDPANPVWVNKVDSIGSIYHVYVEGNYAYILSMSYGNLCIIDINPPDSAYIVKKVDTPFAPYDVQIANGYAYVGFIDYSNYTSGLYIIDVNPPESAYLVNAVDTHGPDNTRVQVLDGYAYVANASDGLQIIDIEPPESAYIVKTVNLQTTSTNNVELNIFAGYAFVLSSSTSNGGLSIIDTDPPESAYLVQTVDINANYLTEFLISDGYAYIGIDGGGLPIIDIDPPESAYIAKTIDMSGYTSGIQISGEYAFVTNSESFYVIDIQSPESAYIFNSVEIPDYIWCTKLSAGYAYLIGCPGLMIIDIYPPESAYIASTTGTEYRSEDIQISNGYAYTANAICGFRITDIEPLESAKTVKRIEPITLTEKVITSDGYAYVIDENAGLQIVDIEPPESAYIVKSIRPGYYKPSDVYVSDGYAYVTSYEFDESVGFLHIIDIDPPGEAYTVKGVYMREARGVFASGGYAYVAAEGFLAVVDVDPPESANIVKKVEFSDYGRGVFVSDGYAYVTSQSGRLRVIDIDPPEDANIVKTVEMPYPYANEVYVSNGYAYVTFGDYMNTPLGNFAIIDIDPPDTANVVASLPTPSPALGFQVSGNYAYIADYHGGMRIIRLY